MFATDTLIYPELTSRPGPRDRPVSVERADDGLWRVSWRNGRMTAYRRDPRPDLELGFEPTPDRTCVAHPGR